MLWALQTNNHSHLFYWSGGTKLSDRYLKPGQIKPGGLTVKAFWRSYTTWCFCDPTSHRKQKITPMTTTTVKLESFLSLSKEPVRSMCFFFPSSAQNIDETACFLHKKKGVKVKAFSSTGPDNCYLTWVRPLFDWSDTVKVGHIQNQIMSDPLCGLCWPLRALLCDK